MTREEIEQKTSLCFLLNPDVSEEEKNYVIERVLATRATIVSKAALCNIITYIMKQNTKLQEKLNKGLWKLWQKKTICGGSRMTNLLKGHEGTKTIKGYVWKI